MIALHGTQTHLLVLVCVCALFMSDSCPHVRDCECERLYTPSYQLRLASQPHTHTRRVCVCI